MAARQPTPAATRLQLLKMAVAEAVRLDAEEEEEEGGGMPKTAAPEKPFCKSHFFLLRKLGEGYYGTVFSVFDQLRRETIAIKIAAYHIYEREDVDFALESEIELLKVLNRKKIPNVTEYFTDGNCEVNGNMNARFYAMRLYDATLADFLSHPSNTITLVNLYLLFFEMLVPLEYFRAMGLVHRDIKPDNILLDFRARIRRFQTTNFHLEINTPMRPVIADFGVSVLHESPSPEFQTGTRNDLIDLIQKVVNVIAQTALRPRRATLLPIKTLERVLADDPGTAEYLSQIINEILKTVLMMPIAKPNPEFAIQPLPKKSDDPIKL